MPIPLTEDPRTVNDVSPRYQIGGLYSWSLAGYGQGYYRYYRCITTAAAGTGDVMEFADGLGMSITGDRDHAGFLTGTVTGVHVGTTVTTLYFGFVQVAGRGIVAMRSDGGVAAGDCCIVDTNDDECDTVAAGTEHEVMALSMVADGADSVAAGGYILTGVL